MSILVTGGGGFVGLSIIEAGLKQGRRVALVSDRSVPAPIVAALKRLPGQLSVHRADVRDAPAVRLLLEQEKPAFLFPFAALTPSPQTEEAEPEKVIDVNLTGFLVQLRAARDAGVRRVIVPASGGVYGESAYEYEWLDEASTPCRPNSIYGMTKFAVETAALRLAALWKMNVVVARIGGVFGPWERQTGAREMFGPHYRMLKLAMAGEDIILPHRFPATSSIYSRDLASALLHLAQLDGRAHDVFNVCSGRDWADDLPHWAERLCRINPRLNWRRAQDDEPSNIVVTDPRDRGKLDISRLKQSGWSPSFLGNSAYDDYADWLRDHADCV